ncbi:MAG: hypothetical protein KBF81_09925 [Aquabacterium sp.]|nr:hypothetical protein [Aquabacterium sp.]
MAKTSTARSGQVIAATFGSGTGVVVGTWVSVDASGVPWVDFPGNPSNEAVPARLIGAVCPAEEGETLTVALVFEGNDRSRPLVLGPVHERAPPATPVLASPVDKQVIVDGQMITLQAETELLLRCGNASILLRRDGKLVIKGTEVVSRASGAHKIRGGQVNIN